jgi:hypothetical protein
VRQYVSQQPVLHLYGWAAARLPNWFTQRSPPNTTASDCSMSGPMPCCMSVPFEKRNGAPQVSAPERALLELLSEVGVRQSLQEARELTENAYNTRADVLRELLQHCVSVKTVRLCLQLGRELSRRERQSFGGRLCGAEMARRSIKINGLHFYAPLRSFLRHGENFILFRLRNRPPDHGCHFATRQFGCVADRHGLLGAPGSTTTHFPDQRATQILMCVTRPLQKIILGPR